MKDIQLCSIRPTKPSDWAIRNVIGGLSVLWGPPGSYKTFTAIGMAMSVAAGQPWVGHRVNEGPVLYILGEGGLDLFRRRAGAYARDARIDVDGLPVWVRGEALDLGDPNKLSLYTPAWDLISPRLIVIDTLSRCLPGDENKQEVMRGFVACCDSLRARYDASVLIIHHDSKSGDMRGSTVLLGAADVSLHIERERDGAAYTTALRADKLRDLDVNAFDIPKLYAKQVECRDDEGGLILDEFGDKVTTVVMQEEQKNMPNVGKLKTYFDEVYQLNCVNNSDTDPSEIFVGYAQWKRHAEMHGITPSTFKRALAALMADDSNGIVSPHRGQYMYSGKRPNPLTAKQGDNYDIEDEDRLIEEERKAREARDEKEGE